MPLREFKAKLIPEIKELNVFVKKNLLSTALAGEVSSSLKGRGIEFEDYRDYTSMDDSSRIDWRASKRAQRVLVREYKLEVNLSVFFLIDTSESMLFASTKKLKCEYAAELVASVYYGILQAGNSVGFGLFNTKLNKMVKPILGKKQFYVFTREIANPLNYGGPKNLGTAIQQTLTLLDRKALIFIISDFIGMNESWVEYMKIMAQKHDIIGIMVRDPRDLTVPKNAGQIIVEDPYSDEKIYIDAGQYHIPYEDEVQRELRLLRSFFQHSRSTVMEFSTDVHYLNPLLQYLRRWGARWR